MITLQEIEELKALTDRAFDMVTLIKHLSSQLEVAKEALGDISRQSWNITMVQTAIETLEKLESMEGGE